MKHRATDYERGGEDIPEGVRRRLRKRRRTKQTVACTKGVLPKPRRGLITAGLKTFERKRKKVWKL